MSPIQRRLLWTILPGVILLAVLALGLLRATRTVSAVVRKEANRIETPHDPVPHFVNTTAVPKTIEPGNVQEQPEDQPAEVESILLQGNGFEPNEITRRHGRFMLAISNRSGSNELSLRLDRLNGNRLHEARMAKGRIRWNQAFNLPPGDYVLSEQNHPEWVCRITLTSQ
jgi:hypothetical protein